MKNLHILRRDRHSKDLLKGVQTGLWTSRSPSRLYKQKTINSREFSEEREFIGVKSALASIGEVFLFSDFLQHFLFVLGFLQFEYDMRGVDFLVFILFIIL